MDYRNDPWTYSLCVKYIRSNVLDNKKIGNKMFYIHFSILTSSKFSVFYTDGKSQLEWLIFIANTWSIVIFYLQLSPGWCDTVDWALACEPKGRQFDSQSGHMPGLRARSPVRGVQEATTRWCFFPVILPPFPSLKINK